MSAGPYDCGGTTSTTRSESYGTTTTSSGTTTSGATSTGTVVETRWKPETSSTSHCKPCPTTEPEKPERASASLKPSGPYPHYRQLRKIANKFSGAAEVEEFRWEVALQDLRPVVQDDETGDVGFTRTSLVMASKKGCAATSEGSSATAFPKERFLRRYPVIYRPTGSGARG